MIKSIGARELKTRLGTYLRQVRDGATIVVTTRGQPVAELRAITPAKTGEEARLQELVGTGLLAPRTGKELTVRKKTVRISDPTLSDTIIEGREDRF